jgi:2-methylisocitrate lyase-like PEP mutase family enzyme
MHWRDRNARKSVTGARAPVYIRDPASGGKCSMSAGAKLRELLKGRMIVAPGAYDAITARCIARAGFSAVYMTGGGTAAMLGYPDYGLTTMSELVENAGRIADSVSLPVIADADTGFGNELNMIRTVHAYEKAGVAALHVEDQGFPKKCGHLDDKSVIPTEEYVAKIRAAASERRDRDFVIIARTDARASNGLDDAIDRVNRAIEAGADVAFVEAPATMAELEAIPGRVNAPCLLNMVRRGKTPDIDLETAERFGYHIAIAPGILIRTVLGACERTLEDFKRTGIPLPMADLTPKETFQRAGADEWDALAARYGAR